MALARHRPAEAALAGAHGHEVQARAYVNPVIAVFLGWLILREWITGAARVWVWRQPHVTLAGPAHGYRMMGMTLDLRQDASDRLRAIATKLLWWKSEQEALADPVRLLCQIMTLGTWDDVLWARNEVGDEAFRGALVHAPPGVMDTRSWNYWHLVFGLVPVPPLPVRRIP